MADIALVIDDPANRMTLKAMLEAAGHRVVDTEAQVAIVDSLARAKAYGPVCPVLMLATAASIPEALAAMRDGAYGYLFIPFQPGEADLMVQRALTAIDPAPRPSPLPTPTLPLDEVEKGHILDTLRRCKNNQAKAARLLGIGRNTVWRKLKKYEQEEAAEEDAEHR